MLFKIMLALMGYYFGKTGMTIDGFLRIIEALISRNGDE